MPKSAESGITKEEAFKLQKLVEEACKATRQYVSVEIIKEPELKMIKITVSIKIKQ